MVLSRPAAAASASALFLNSRSNGSEHSAVPDKPPPPAESGMADCPDPVWDEPPDAEPKPAPLPNWLYLSPTEDVSIC